MNSFSNIWNHPRTSFAGLLISIATVAGVLAQSGIGLGKVGTGTVVSLAGAVATALLGLLSRDPASLQVPAGTCSGNCSQPSGSAAAKLSVWLLIVLLLPLPWLEGCTASSVAKNIVNWTPSLQSAVATVDSTAAVLVPIDAAHLFRRCVGLRRRIELAWSAAGESLSRKSIGQHFGPVAVSDRHVAAASQCRPSHHRPHRQLGQPAACHGRHSGSRHHRQHHPISLVQSISSKAAVKLRCPRHPQSSSPRSCPLHQSGTGC